MSRENVELLRGFTAAYNARDPEVFIAYCDPRVELHSTFAAVGGAVYHGHDGVRAFFRDMETVWGDEIHSEPEAYFDLGENTPAFTIMRGRGKHGGVDVAMPIARAARWREGLIVYTKSYTNGEDALIDLRVSEHELEPIAP
jgi:hypothetical protein